MQEVKKHVTILAIHFLSMAQILSTLDGLVDTRACNMPIKYVLENEDIYRFS